MEFPLFTTIISGVDGKFDVNDPESRAKYFQAKAGDKIEAIKEYLEKGTFIGFLMAKKMAGKGTYSKIFEELVGSNHFAHVSVGDIVRDAHKAMDDPKEKKELVDYLHDHYRGYISVDESLDALLGRNTKTLVPTEFILTLVRREIEKIGDKGLFIDGFPRSLDQVSYSLYFREIMNLRPDPDFFVLIDIAEEVINERMLYRVVCPLCKTSRNTRLLPTKFVSYDSSDKSFNLICDNKECQGYEKEQMVGKEGDELGIDNIRDRLEMDGKLIQMADSLAGVPKVYLRNAVPVTKAKKTVDDYEITPEYNYEWDKKSKKVIIKEKPWTVKDDQGVESYSLLAAPVVLSLIDQLYKLLIE